MSKNNILEFNSPAESLGNLFLEGLVSSNGEVFASSLGGAVSDKISIVNANVFCLGARGVLPDVSTSMKNIRLLIKDKMYTKAADELSNALIKNGYNPKLGITLPIAELELKCDFENDVSDYKRTLNLSSGEVKCNFKVGNCKIEKNMVVTRDGTILIEIKRVTGSKGINLTTSVNQIKNFPDAKQILKTGVKKYEGNFAYLGYKNEDGQDYGLVLKIERVGGTLVTNKDDGIIIENADKVLILMKTFALSIRDKEFLKIKNELNINKNPYEKFLKDTANARSKEFDETDINLYSSTDSEVKTMLHQIREGGLNTECLEKIFNYAKNQVVSFNEKTIQTAYLGYNSAQFDETAAVVVDSVYNMYNLAASLNMPEKFNAVFGYYEKVYDDLKKNATRLFGVRGIFVPAVSSLNSGLLASNETKIAFDLSAGAKIAMLYYNYYLMTGDEKFLKTKGLDFMKDVCIFYADLIEEKQILINPNHNFTLALELLKAFIFESEKRMLYKADVNLCKEVVSILEKIITKEETKQTKQDRKLATSVSLIDYANLLAKDQKTKLALAEVENVIKFLTLNNLSIISADFKGNFFGKTSSNVEIRRDANITLADTLLNLFVASSSDTIYINNFTEIIDKFTIENVLTRTGKTISMDLNKGVLNIKLRAYREGLFNIQLPKNFKKVKGIDADDYDSAKNQITLNLLPGKTLSFSAM